MRLLLPKLMQYCTGTAGWTSAKVYICKQFCNLYHPCCFLISISTSLPLLPSRVWRDLDVAPCNWKSDDIKCSLCTLDIYSHKNWALGLIRGTSASFNFAKAQTWARNTTCIKHIEGFQIPRDTQYISGNWGQNCVDHTLILKLMHLNQHV